jgi:universal stress protein A
MGEYNRILVAVDISDEAVEIAEKASRIAAQNGAELHIVHAIEPLSFAYGGDIPIDFSSIQEEIQQQAETQLHALCNKLTVPLERLHVVFGRPESEIHALAAKLPCDLIIVGSHGRHGLALLLGSTANGVLHGAKCDVLAVKVS